MKSASSSSVNGETKGLFAVSITEGVSLASVMAGEGDEDAVTILHAEQDCESARKLDFAATEQQSTSSNLDVSTPGLGIHESCDVGLSSGGAWSRLSVRDELLTQLNGEKLRVTELTAKINEMYRLEEKQRTKARELADVNDRLEGLRDHLEERIRALQLLNDELEKQSEIKEDRIKELEQQLSGWTSRHDALEQELFQCRTDVANLMDEDAEHVSQRDVALSKLEQALSFNLKMKNDLDTCNAEKKELIKQNKALLHQRDEMVGKVATLEASVSSFRSELNLMTQKWENVKITVQNRDTDIENLTKLLSSAELRIGELTDELEAFQLQNDRGATLPSNCTDKELLSEEARKFLQEQVTDLEAALAKAEQQHQGYKNEVEKDKQAIRQSYETQLDEYQTMGEKLEKKLTEYKHRLKTLQKTQQNGASELFAENESLKSMLNDKQIQIDAMKNQLTLGEQSWVQQSAVLKASVQELVERNDSLKSQVQTAEKDIALISEKFASSMKSESCMPQAKLISSSTAEQNQIIILENRIKNISVKKKWKVILKTMSRTEFNLFYFSKILFLM